jgi:hypothetical protein
MENIEQKTIKVLFIIVGAGALITMIILILKPQ